MDIDKELYRQAYEFYRQWNRNELIERARNAGQRDPQEAWRQYQALWKFAAQMGLEQSDRQRQLKIASIEHYYEQVQKLEAWRKIHGRGT
jgi:hypothetical protein